VTCDHQISTTMPGEVFNPNPTVFSLAKPIGRKSDLPSYSLWMHEVADTEDAADEIEPIDQDEIFGRSI
jgi:hypothetical protein